MNDAPSAPAKLAELRALLKTRFPEAHTLAPLHADPEAIAAPRFGIPALDQQGLPARGGLVEIVSPGFSRGNGLLLGSLLESVLARGSFAALIDGRDGFDPGSLPADLLPRLLWVRCRRADQVPRCADVLLRDGNLPVIVADLQFNPVRDLQRIPDSSWFRLRALAEAASILFLAFTPCKTIAGARLRLQVNQFFTLDAMDTPRGELIVNLPITALLQQFPRTTLAMPVPTLAKAG